MKEKELKRETGKKKYYGALGQPSYALGFQTFQLLLSANLVSKTR